MYESQLGLVMCRETVLCAGYVRWRNSARGKVSVRKSYLCASYVPICPIDFVAVYGKIVMYGVMCHLCAKP